MTTTTFWTGVICFIIGAFIGVLTILFFAGAKPHQENTEDRPSNVVPFR